LSPKYKLKFSITTKDPSQKQIIISMSTNNTERVIVQANKYITNINRLLKGVKSEISADYIHSDNKEITIASFDLSIVKKY